jgi:hypothetical protein
MGMTLGAVDVSILDVVGFVELHANSRFLGASLLGMTSISK